MSLKIKLWINVSYLETNKNLKLGSLNEKISSWLCTRVRMRDQWPGGTPSLKDIQGVQN